MNSQVTPMPVTTQVVYTQPQAPLYVDLHGQPLKPEQVNAVRLNELKASLQKDKKKYKKQVIIAATTACYFWLPLGLIPAVVVAAVFGSRAAQKYDDIKDKKREIATLERSNVIVVNTAGPTPSYAA